MSDKLVDRLNRRTSESLDDSTATTEDGTEDFGAFGIHRGVKDRAVMLQLRKKDGHVLAIGYGWIDRAEFDPAEGIQLHAGTRLIKITGRNLNGEIRSHVRLFESICRHRVGWVQEASEASKLEVQKNAVLIENIEW